MRAAVALPLLVLAGCSSHAATRAPDHRLTAVSASLERLAANGRFSGDVLVARDGRPVLARAYGIANRSTGERNRLDTRFNLASLGKSFTAVAVARLVEDGKLRFSDAIGRYLPQLPPALRRITVAQLLDHTSGLGDFFASPDYTRLQPTLTSLARYLPLIRGAAPSAPPGRFRYSNSGYILLGLIVQRASGVSYYAFLRREVFDRAGMTRSGCFRKDRLPPGTAVGVTFAGRSNTRGLPPRGTSAGGCYSTVGDLLRFANALLSHRLLDPGLSRTITTPKVAVGPHGAYGYGFGIRLGPRRKPPTVWHDGGSPGVGAELDVNPGLGWTVVVLANRDYAAIRPAIDAVLGGLRIP